MLVREQMWARLESWMSEYQREYPTQDPHGNYPADQGLTAVEVILVVFGGLATWILPLVLWMVWKDTQPLKARQSWQIFLILTLISVFLFCCAVTVFFGPLMIAGSGLMFV